ncbi:MAG: carboxypeptidase-like regulatory domain-containing protein, partial [Bryobacteraceae bacterium]
TVTLSSQEIGLQRTFTTSTDGLYVFTSAPAGTYTLKVEKQGFASYIQSGIVLAVAQAATEDVTLRVGNVTEQVSVTAAAPMINQVNANVTSLVTERQAVELPLNQRNVFYLLALNSSVNNSVQWQGATNGSKAPGLADAWASFMNFGGSRFETTPMLLDGHWETAGDWAELQYAPTVDAIQEFRIETNTFSAQYGWSMGNVVEAITKSGTSAFHGDAYEFLRNSALDANYFFNNSSGLPKTPFKRNQFGFTAGGPLYLPKIYQQRDKTFFLMGYEGLREETPTTLVASVPTTAMRSGDFSQLSGAIYNPFTTQSVTTGFVRDPFPGNIIPASMINPIAKNIGAYYPNPTTGGVVNNFVSSLAATGTIDSYTVRVDHNFSDNTRLFGRYSQKWINETQFPPSFGPTNPAGPGFTSFTGEADAALDFNHIFSPTFIWDVNVGWNRDPNPAVHQGHGFLPSTLGFPSSLDVANSFPSVSMDDEYGLSPCCNNIYIRQNNDLSTDFTKIAGAHTLNFGFQALDFTINGQSYPQALYFYA